MEDTNQFACLTAADGVTLRSGASETAPAELLAVPGYGRRQAARQIRVPAEGRLGRSARRARSLSLVLHGPALRSDLRLTPTYVGETT